MKASLIVANWKSHMKETEAIAWLEGFKSFSVAPEKTVVVCSPFTLISALSQKRNVEQISIKLGVQNISPFNAGAYTGEVNGEQIKEFVEYVIIGHSERRQYFKETDEMLAEKVQRAKEVGLTIVFCVQGSETPVPKEVDIVAYEPIWAIGSGKAESSEQANEVAKAIKMKNTQITTVLYGGSVTEENVHLFTQMSDLGGVLVGGASLDPQKFSQIISHA